MAVISVWPTENDVGGSGLGRAITEFKWGQVGFNNHNWVHSGLATSDGGGLNLTVAAGVAWVDGFRVDWGSDTVALNASANNRVYLQLTFDGGSKVDGAQITVRTDTTVSSDAVMLADVRTGASSIAGIQDRRPLQSWGAIGTYDTVTGILTNSVVLGFRPAVLTLVSANGSPPPDLHIGEVWDSIVSFEYDLSSGGVTFAIQNYGFSVTGSGDWDVSTGYYKALFGSHV